MVRVTGIDHLVVRVSDYQKSKDFYGRLFTFMGFEISDEFPEAIGWTNGKTRYWIAPAEGRKKHRIGDVGLHHYAFELRNRKDVDALQAFLKDERVRIVDPADEQGRKRKYRDGDIGFHHYAFQLRSRKEVDALQAFLDDNKVTIVDRAGEHYDDYYAVFFLDPDGLKLEGMKWGEKTAARPMAG